MSDNNDYRSLSELIMKKISYCFLFMLVFFGCGNDDEKVLKGFIKDEMIEDKPKKIAWEKDGKEMVLIPSGSFEMGGDFGISDQDELPTHLVTLDGFFMDRTEVTVKEFKVFLFDSGYDWLGNWADVNQDSPTDSHPMTYVTWYDAQAYAKWAGKRLPSEAQWEYAARGGLERKLYPWGNKITKDDGNYEGASGKDEWGQSTSPVGSFEDNGYNLYDMAGNVYEWCYDRYGENYYSRSPIINPLGPDSRPYGFRVLRGGSWHDSADALRVARRYSFDPTNRNFDNGFRCVADIQ